MAGYSGKLGTVTINSVAEPITEWTADVTADMLDDTNSTDAGEETFVAGVTGIRGTLKMNYGSGTHMSTVIPGAALTTLVLLAYTGKTISVATAIVESVALNVTMRGMVEMTVTWRGQGTTLATALTSM